MLAFAVKAQNVTLDELIDLKKHDLAYVEEYLTNKGWTYFGNGDISQTLFAYNKGHDSDKAESFISYFPSLLSDNALMVEIQIHNPNKYTSYLNRIKSFGCKLIDSYTKNKEIVKIYQGATTTFMIRVYTKYEYFSTTTLYEITIVSNEIYDLTQIRKQK
ncbi:MAG: hypothetical protein LBE36_10760 [Flavobacteriaceae bacterium]|nr:hypothetical protein [Flavobacteriaceae bacterium]